MKGFLDRHAAKLLVVLIAAAVLIPTGLAYNYSKSQRKTADQAKTASQEAKAASAAARALAIENRALVKRIARLQHRLVDGLVESCRVNGNPLRAAEREDLREAITSPHDPRLRELFPGAAPAAIERIIEEANVRKRKRLAKIKHVNCAKAYLPVIPQGGVGGAK